MIILDRAQFLDHVRVGRCSGTGAPRVMGIPSTALTSWKSTAPDQDFPMWRVLTWLVSISDQRIFGAPEKDTAKLLQELTAVDDFFRNGGWS